MSNRIWQEMMIKDITRKILGRLLICNCTEFVSVTGCPNKRNKRDIDMYKCLSPFVAFIRKVTIALHWIDVMIFYIYQFIYVFIIYLGIWKIFIP